MPVIREPSEYELSHIQRLDQSLLTSQKALDAARAEIVREYMSMRDGGGYELSQAHQCTADTVEGI